MMRSFTSRHLVVLLAVVLPVASAACDPAASTVGDPSAAAPVGVGGTDQPATARPDPTGVGQPATVAGVNAPVIPALPAPALEGPKPLQVVREFTCDPGAITRDTAVSDVQNMEGATVDIRPLPGEAGSCNYHLLFRDLDGTVSQLSPADDPGGYLLAIAGRSPAGHVMVCASDIDHDVDPEGTSVLPGEQPRRIDGVGIDCAVRAGGHWSSLARVIEPDGDWAAWVVGLEAADSGNATFRVVWIRDFSFQFLNLSDEGRPVGDGIYATVVSLADDGALQVGATELISELIVPQEAHEYGAWEPTDDELDELGEFITPDDGDCPPPYGCK